MELQSWSKQSMNFPLVVAQYSKSGDQLKSTILSTQECDNANSPAFPRLQTSEGTIHGSLAISKYLSSEELLGGARRLEVEDWMNWCQKEVVPTCQAILYVLTGQMRLPNDKLYKQAVSELKATLEGINKALGESKYLIGDQITLADLHLATYLYYPICLAFNPQYRNKILNIMNWFTPIYQSPEFTAVFGNTKLLTNPLKQPIFKKKQEEAKESPNKKTKKKKGKNQPKEEDK